ncbi:MAG: DUF1361 domain-containing protein [Verrucomicrobiota bacterium]
MNYPLSISSRQLVWLLLLLVAGSILGVGLVSARFIASGRFAYFNLVWNLILAWVPVGFAMLAWRLKASRLALLVCGFLWLLFFPNCGYILTDLVHLRERPPVPFWFDLVLIQSFILLGLVLGFVSLYKMQELVANFLGRWASWLFVLLVICLTGFGIYLGRVQRWNSWDLFVNPIDLLTDIFRLMFRPHRRTVGIYSLLYAGFFFTTYACLYLLTHFKTEKRAIENVAD